MTNENLSQEYRKSAELLNQRLMVLNQELTQLKLQSSDPKKDGAVLVMQDRINVLTKIKTELVEVEKEVRHYYNRSHWRNEKLTMNQRVRKLHKYAVVIYDDE